MSHDMRSDFGQCLIVNRGLAYNSLRRIGCCNIAEKQKKSLFL